MAKDFDSKELKDIKTTYDISIANGTGSEKVANGTYSAVGKFDGFDNSTLNPKSFTVRAGVTVYNLTIAATGTLNIHVTEEGTPNGTPVEGAIFVRCDETGATTYGDPVTSNANGVAAMQFLPHGNNQTVYFKQTATATDHEYDTVVRAFTLANQTETTEVPNPVLTQRVFNITDRHYHGATIPSGTLTLTK